MKICKTEKHLLQKADKNTSVGLRAPSKPSMKKAGREEAPGEAGREQSLAEQSREHSHPCSTQPQLPGHSSAGCVCHRALGDSTCQPDREGVTWEADLQPHRGTGQDEGQGRGAVGACAG